MDFSPLQAFIDSLIDFGIPSCDVIVQKNHETLFRYTAGWRDREKGLPLRGDEKYLMYSVSKPVTALAGMLLVERGQMLLTDPVADYLPEYKDITVKRPDGTVTKAEKVMRVKHLFSMTAGLDYDFEKPAIKRVTAEKGESCATRDIAWALAQEPLSFEPGEHWQYSLCHDVLAALIEAASGVRFRDFVRDNIFAPLGMTHSAYHFSADEEESFAAQYRYDDSARSAERIALSNAPYNLSPHYDSGGAGVVSTVEDYARLADALACGGVSAEGTRIVSRAAIDLMRENQLGPEQMPDFNWDQLRGYGYGLGVRTVISRAQGGVMSPVGEFGWGGAAGSYLMVDPDHGLSVFYAQHMLNNKEPYIHPRIRNIVYGIVTGA